MSELSILTALVRAGMTVEAACAMGGNIQAESRFNPKNLQDTCERALGYNDESYTRDVDSRAYFMERFVYDKAGYGLCQWTLASRKELLWRWAEYYGKSIGDEAMQTDFCIAECRDYFPDLWKFLCETQDGYGATKRICYEYENPAVKNVDERFGYARDLYLKYGEKLAEVAKDINAPDTNVGYIDREPASYIMPTVRTGDHSPEASFLMAHLMRLGYDVLWLGLDACLRDFQQKRGLEADGICGEKTWRELLK